MKKPAFVVFICLNNFVIFRMYRCYQALIGEFPSDALEDLTGGLTVTYYLGNETPEHLKKTLLKSVVYLNFTK